MTDQEIYTKVRTHLLAQNKKSLRGERCMETCAYRGKDGTMCAVGCLIPDSYYDAAFEGWSVEDNRVREAAGITFAQNKLVLTLQRIHDAYDPSQWRSELDRVAHNYKLRIED